MADLYEEEQLNEDTDFEDDGEDGNVVGAALPAPGDSDESPDPETPGSPLFGDDEGGREDMIQPGTGVEASPEETWAGLGSPSPAEVEEPRSVEHIETDNEISALESGSLEPPGTLTQLLFSGQKAVDPSTGEPTLQRTTECPCRWS